MMLDYPMPIPAGLARYDGTGGAAVKLTDTPAFGVALPADPVGDGGRAIPGDMRTVRYLDLEVSAIGVMVTYDGVTAPTAVNGFPLNGAENWKGVFRGDLVSWQFFLPNTVKLYVRYFWGSK